MLVTVSALMPTVCEESQSCEVMFGQSVPHFPPVQAVLGGLYGSHGRCCRQQAADSPKS